jgi:hypothetical protein
MHAILEEMKELTNEAAVCQIAVDDFEAVMGEDSVQALTFLKLELDMARLKLMEFMWANGTVLRLLILVEQADHIVKTGFRGVDLGPLTPEERRKALFGK